MFCMFDLGEWLTAVTCFVRRSISDPRAKGSVAQMSRSRMLRFACDVHMVPCIATLCYIILFGESLNHIESLCQLFGYIPGADVLLDCGSVYMRLGLPHWLWCKQYQLHVTCNFSLWFSCILALDQIDSGVDWIVQYHSIACNCMFNLCILYIVCMPLYAIVYPIRLA